MVKVEHYFNRYIYETKEHLQDDINKAIQLREQAKQAILALCMATPRDITPNDSSMTPVDAMTEEFNAAWEVYEDADQHLFALNTILEGWDTKVEG